VCPRGFDTGRPRGGESQSRFDVMLDLEAAELKLDLK
jgi:hypothetical protein